MSLKISVKPQPARSATAFLLLSILFPAFIHLHGQNSSTPPVKPTPTRSVAVTIDDLPGAVPGSDDAMGDLTALRNWNRGVLQALAKHHAPAIGFVIERKLRVEDERDARAAILEDWIQAGLDLGNHTYSHTHFSQVTLQQFEDDTVRGDVVTRQLLTQAGRSEVYFRHPALDVGRSQTDKDAFAAFLEAHHYRVAPVSVEDADYKFNDVLDAALRSGNRIKADTVRRLYLDHARSMFDFVEDASHKLYGREIPQILLIHDNLINSLELDSLLADLETRGYRFVSLTEALADPVYQPGTEATGGLGDCYICWGDRLHKRAQPLNYRWSSEPSWINDEFQTIRKAQEK